MSVSAGRQFLSIPGPTTVPDEVLQAMHRPAVDIYTGSLVGVTTSLPGLESPSEDIWRGSRGRVRVQQFVSFTPPERGRFERVYSHLTVTAGGESEHRDSTYRLRCYSREQWNTLLGRSALVPAGTFDASGKRVDPPRLGYAVWALKHRA